MVSADDSKFSYYSDLQPNFYKCEIAGIGSLKWDEVAVCGINCVNLKVNTIKILGIDFSYNKLNMAKKFWTAISNIQNVLKIWHMRNLTLESKIIVHLSYINSTKTNYWRIYRQISFGTVQLRKLNIVLSVILLH